jgi:ATP-dependent helicase YprA (DUF1998 family)
MNINETIDEDYELISAYQDLVREDINSILRNEELSDKTINSVLSRYSENPDKLKANIDFHGLLSRDSCGKQHTIHGLLIKSLIKMKFLPFENYLPMVEFTVLKGDDDLPGIKEPVLEYKESMDNLIREIEQIDNRCGSKYKETAKIILNAFKNGENIRNVSRLQRDYIIEYIKNKCYGINKNYVIDAPTGSGKTLIFAFMALFEALLGNRVFIIYPRKQLAEDQANRFIKYVYYVRDELKGYRWPGVFSFNHPTLMIVDGDHAQEPPQINNKVPLNHQKVAKKTLKCPACNDILMYDPNQGKIMCSRGHEINFLYVFKNDLNNRPSIVITNRHVTLSRLLHQNTDLRTLLDRVNMVILDEAHVYTNLEGGDTALFIRLLNDYVKMFNNGREPTWVISSATMPKAEEFAMDLIGKRDLVHYDYRSYSTNTYKLIVPILLLPTQFSTETIAQFAGLITLLWAYSYGNKALMFIDSRTEIARLIHYIKDTILGRGGFDTARMPGDIILYHTKDGINMLRQKIGKYSTYNIDCDALWDHLLDDRARNAISNLVKNNNQQEWLDFLSKSKLRDRIDFHYAWQSGERRTALFNKFRQGDVSMLLATSTLELGIDVPDVSVVIQYKLPFRSESFIQRIGRAGRNPGSYRIVIGVLILSPSPLSATYMYDNDLQQRLINVDKMPKPPVNLTNIKLELKHEFYKLLLDYKYNNGNTHYPEW